MIWSSIFTLLFGWSLATEFTWENATTDLKHHHTKNYTIKLEKDAIGFVEKVLKWTKKELEDDVELPVHFDFQVKNDALAAREKPCGDLLIHRFFSVMKSFIKHPELAEYTINKARSLSWHPSWECMQRHNYTLLDGGAGVGFEVRCNDDVLLKAGAGAGGLLRKNGGNAWESKYYGGSAVGVQLLNGDIDIAGAVTGSWNAGLIRKVFKRDPKIVSREVHHLMNECAKRNKLTVRGGGGGGWHELFSTANGTSKDVVGYGFGFEIGHPIDDVDTSGSAVEDDDSMELLLDDFSSAESPLSDASSNSNEEVHDVIAALVNETQDQIHSIEDQIRSKIHEIQSHSPKDILDNLKTISNQTFQQFYHAGEHCSNRTTNSPCFYQKAIRDFTSPWYLPTTTMNMLTEPSPPATASSSFAFAGGLVLVAVIGAVFFTSTYHRRQGYTLLPSP